MKKTVRRGVLVGVLATTSLLATACPAQPPESVNFAFKATQVTVNSSQDEIRDPIFGTCISLTGCSDEPYVLMINFRVKIGEADSAQTWVTGSRSYSQSSMGAGSTRAVTGNAQATANFNNVVPLDVLDLLDTNNHLEITGSYVWAMEEDTVGVGAAADKTASVLKDALNDTIAKGSVPSDTNQLLSLITSNLGSAIVILAQNIPLFGLGDDVMGGGMYVGIAAKGGLADIVNNSIASTPFPNLSIPAVDLPPDITRGGFYTTTTSKDFNGQQWSCCGGSHTWNFNAGPVAAAA
ncbi:MAG: hypothetical protein R2698_07245 [Microthrixaceae bacterium]